MARFEYDDAAIALVAVQLMLLRASGLPPLKKPAHVAALLAVTFGSLALGARKHRRSVMVNK